MNKRRKNTVSPSPTEKSAESIFEARFELFMSQFQKACQKENVPAAVAIVVDPQNPGTPLLCGMGSIYNQCKLLAESLKILKNQLLRDLS